MTKSKKSRIQSQSDALEELLRSTAIDEIRKLRDAFTRILDVKEKLLIENESEREKLSEKVQSLENQVENLKRKNMESLELEEKITKLEKSKSVLMKHLLLERTKVKQKEEEISILKGEDFPLPPDIQAELDMEEPPRWDSIDISIDEDAKDESDDESDEEETTTTRDDQRVVVKKQITSDDEDGDVTNISNISRNDSTEEKSDDRLLQDMDTDGSEDIDDLLKTTFDEINSMTC